MAARVLRTCFPIAMVGGICVSCFVQPNWLFLYPGMVAMLAGLAWAACFLAVDSHQQYSAGVGHSCLLQHFVVVGFRLFFSRCSRACMPSRRVIPKTARDRKYGQLITLERGLVIERQSCCRLDCGLYAVWEWKQHASACWKRTDRKNRHSIFRALSLGIEIIFSVSAQHFWLEGAPTPQWLKKLNGPRNDAGNAKRLNSFIAAAAGFSHSHQLPSVIR